MFSISLQTLLKDIFAIAGCFTLTVVICLIYLFFAKRSMDKIKEEKTRFSQVWAQKKNSVFIQYGLGAIFSFFCAYGCKLVLLKIVFAVIYAFFTIKLFINNKETNE